VRELSTAANIIRSLRAENDQLKAANTRSPPLGASSPQVTRGALAVAAFGVLFLTYALGLIAGVVK